jgi:hypothetical protein
VSIGQITPATVQQINTESECGTSAASQYVTAGNGQIYGPNGQPVVFNGVAVDEQELPQAVGTLAQSLPGTNIVRLAVFDLNKDTAAYLMPYVLQLNAQGITVEIEDHNYPDVLTGPALQQAAQWYQSLAAAFIGDPYVIFGTQNEPSGSPGDVQTMITTIYNAIRSTGNNTLTLITAAGGTSLAGFSESTFANMSNVAFDLHLYNWLANYSSSLAANQSTLASMVAQTQAFADQGGAIPVIIGEYGNATDGSNVDPGGQQVVQAVDNAVQTGQVKGAIAWEWHNPYTAAADSVMMASTGGATDGQYGQSVAGSIASNSSPVSCQSVASALASAADTSTSSPTPISTLDPALSMAGVGGSITTGNVEPVNSITTASGGGSQ